MSDKVQQTMPSPNFFSIGATGRVRKSANYPNPAKSPVCRTAALRAAVTVLIQATGLDALVLSMSSQRQGQAVISLSPRRSVILL